LALDEFFYNSGDNNFDYDLYNHLYELEIDAFIQQAIQDNSNFYKKPEILLLSLILLFPSPLILRLMVMKKSLNFGTKLQKIYYKLK
jgi:hypothetical protein